MDNSVLKAIADRRSNRAYSPEQITESQLQSILEAGKEAPSANNKQPWHFTAVQNSELLKRVNEAFRVEMLKRCNEEMRPRFSDPAYSVFYHAPTVIFISCPDLAEMAYAQTDAGMAIQNMALAAHSLGLGSVILGMPRLAFAGEEAASLREALAFPKGFDYCLSIAIGTPLDTKDAHPMEPDRVTILR